MNNKLYNINMIMNLLMIMVFLLKVKGHYKINLYFQANIKIVICILIVRAVFNKQRHKKNKMHLEKFMKKLNCKLQLIYF